MKNLLLVAATLFFGSYFVSAQENTPATPVADPNAPGMIFEFETYDFGDIQEGDDASVDFVFSNPGKDKLIITDVKASCGCTTPAWSKEPVLPGEKGIVTAKYNTQGRPGTFNKAITITSNGSEETKRIFIKGNVIGSNAANGEEISKKNGVPERVPSIVNDLSDN